MAAHQWIEAFQERQLGTGDVAPLAASWECDLANDGLRWAPGVFELFGLPLGARLDRREIVEMYVGESRVLLDRLRADAIATCGSFTFDAQIRRIDGELRWMRLTADVLAQNGRAVRLYGTKQDITAEIAR
ncbi:PAS domain-containing protein [Sphingomonas sp. JC676]|uniref:PAS domain-containing protein n=1 Tax=Sphingomonas sp. JC676 TaxID=2768065 RepID=UPI0016578353|nr:PAS domain-containing protein [Sphingomonas sp. JC676]MBC9033640.1 PAS domain-containing protein [Sphingomonas sp. JC676]